MAACVLAGGCAERRSPPPVDTSRQPAATAEAQSGAAGGSLDAGASRQPAGQSAPPPDQVAGAADATNDGGQLSSVGPENARRGSTITGGGIITEPAKQYFQIQHRLAFIQVEQAEKLYKAEHGSMPRSHEEYMAEVIGKNEIELPELDPGWDYYYDAQREELMRRRTR